MDNQTTENNEFNRGEMMTEMLKNALRPIWQGHEESNLNLRFWRPLY